MRIHYVQHVWFEEPRKIKDWAVENNFSLTRTAFFNKDKLPEIQDIDWLFILGGPMSTHEEDKYPWLKEEKYFIEKAIKQGKTIIGVCLGAQIIANVLGARIYKNKYKEIGWFPVQRCENNSSQLFGFPEEFSAFHWHGDTFDIPKGAVHLFKSKSCLNQAFSYNSHVIGLQFHLELNEKGIVSLVEQCGDELIDGLYIQKKEHMLNQTENIYKSNKLMYKILKNFRDNKNNLNQKDNSIEE